MGNSLWNVAKNSLKISKLSIKFVRNYKIVKSLEYNLGSFCVHILLKMEFKKVLEKD